MDTDLSIESICMPEMGNTRVTVDRGGELDVGTRQYKSVAKRVGSERSHGDDPDRLDNAERVWNHKRASPGQPPVGVLESGVGTGTRTKGLGVVQSQPSRPTKGQVRIIRSKGGDNGRQNCRVGKIDAGKETGDWSAGNCDFNRRINRRRRDISSTLNQRGILWRQRGVSIGRGGIRTRQSERKHAKGERKGKREPFHGKVPG